MRWLRDRGHRDSGQGAIEYVGLAVLAAVLVLSLVEIGAPGAIAQLYRSALCRIESGTSCPAGNGRPSASARPATGPVMARPGTLDGATVDGQRRTCAVQGVCDFAQAAASSASGFGRTVARGAAFFATPFKPAPDGPVNQPGGPVAGPGIGNGEVGSLPFPGTVSGEASRTGKGGIKATVTQTRGCTSPRLEVRPDGNLGRSVDLSLTVDVSAGQAGQAEGGRGEGSASLAAGTSSAYTVTVTPEQADAIKQGKASPPNPYDPNSMPLGTTITRNREEYAKSNLEGQYRALKVGVGDKAGREVKSAVQRVDAKHVRVLVGSAGLVDRSLGVGLKEGSGSIGLNASKKGVEGRMRQMDIDISTPEGWAAYQDFVKTGTLPGDADYVSNAATVDSHTFTSNQEFQARVDATKLGADFGASIGANLGSSDLSLTTTRKDDGTTQHSTSYRGRNGITWKATQGVDQAGSPGPARYELLLPDADPSVMRQYEGMLTGRPPSYNGNQDVRLGFTEQDLQAMQNNVYDYVARRCQGQTFGSPVDCGPNPPKTAAEAKALLQGKHPNDPLVTSMLPQDPNLGGLMADVATARNSTQILAAMSRSLAGGSNQALDNLMHFASSIAAGRTRNQGQFLPGHLVTARPSNAAASPC